MSELSDQIVFWWIVLISIKLTFIFFQLREIASLLRHNVQRDEILRRKESQ